MTFRIYTMTGKKPAKSDRYGVYVIEAVNEEGAPIRTWQRFGSCTGATRNEAEVIILLAVLKKLEQIRGARPKLNVEIYTESEHLHRSVTVWMKDWKRDGWKNSKGEPIADRKRWEELELVFSQEEASWHVGEEHPYRRWMQYMIKRKEKPNV